MKIYMGRQFFIKLSVLLLSLGGILTVYGAAGDVDNSFNASAYGALNGSVQIIKRQPDGKYLIGGYQYNINGFAGTGLGRLNADLTIDTSFNPPNLSGSSGLGGVNAIAFQSDGRIIIGGTIWSVDNVFDPGLKRLLPNGALDSSFQSIQVATSFTYLDIEVLPNDKFFAGGRLYNADGTVDSSFPLISNVRKMKLQPDGKVLVADLVSGISTLRRYNADGSLDGAFTAVPTNGVINSILYLSDGKIIIGGGFSTINGFSQGRISRINQDGSLDLMFNQNMSGFSAEVKDFVLRADGKLSVAGFFDFYNGSQAMRLALINADGSLDNSFRSAIPSNGHLAQDVEILPNGKWLVGFNSNSILNTIYLFNADGTFDNSLNVVASRGESVNRIIQQPDGKIIAVGNFQYSNGARRRSMVRWNLDGSLDASFVPYFTTAFSIDSVALQPDGKFVVGTRQPSQRLVRLNADGTRDLSLTMPPNLSEIYDLAVLADGKILITNGGNVYRLNANGSFDGTFTTLGFNNSINRMLVQPDGKILIGGAFTGAGAVGRGRIVRLNVDGTIDTSFNPTGGANGTVNDLDLTPDGKVVIGGAFTAVNGNPNQKGVGRFNSDGSLDTTFVQNQTFDTPVIGLEVLPDNKIVVAGGFTTIGSTPRSGIARINSNGSIDPTFNTFIFYAPTLPARDVYLQTDGKILVGGDFNKVNNSSHVGIVRLLNPAVSPALFDYDGDGKADVSVFRPSENRWYILRSSDFGFTQAVFAAAGDIPTPADYDGDGKTDLAVFRPSNGDWWYLSSATGAQNNLHWGQSGDVPRPGDFDGDGKADFIVFRPSDNTWYRLGSGGTTSITVFGTAGDKPLNGDFDGDGKTDLAVYRPSTGVWWYAASSAGGQFRAGRWGVASDIPAPADYDGDGKTDFAVYRPSEGLWFVFNSGNGSQTILNFGLSGDKPVPADYDGDGRADIAVFRPSDGVWYLLRSTAGFGAFNWGISSDIPTENAFVP